MLRLKIFLLVILFIKECSPERVLVGLGVSSEGLSTDFEVIDVDDVTTTCKKIPELPEPEKSLAPEIQLKSKVRKKWKPSSTFVPEFLDMPQSPAVFFRMNNRNPAICRKDDCFQFEDNVWQKIKSPEMRRRFSSTTVVSSQNNDVIVVVTGGENVDASTFQDSVEIFSSGVWKVKGELKLPISRHCSVQMSASKVMLIGGRFESSQFSTQTLVLDFQKGSITSGPKINIGRQLHSCARIGGQEKKNIVVVGGRDFTGALSSVEIFRHPSTKFIDGPELPIKVSYASLVEDSLGGVLLIGGQSGAQILDSIYRLRISGTDGSWELLPSRLKTPRRFPVAVVVPDKITDCSVTPDPGPETESDWHFIFGGKRSTELFNWKTAQRCYLPNEPPIRMQHPSGVLFNRETPAACCAKQCMVFNRTTLNWTMISQLSTVISGEGSVFIPDRGWFIFGGHDRLLKDSATFAQRLADLDAKWERGPSLYMPYADSTKCVIQFNDTLTVFIGGHRNPNEITTYDWSTGSYGTETSLQERRSSSGCTTMKDETGNDVIVIVGGRLSAGMELFDPRAGRSRLISKTLYRKFCLDCTLVGPAVISVSNGTELIVYGGYHRQGISDGSDDDDDDDDNYEDVSNDLSYEKDGTSEIWKFSFAQNWTCIGNMMIDRWTHLVFPIKDVRCP